MKNNICPIPDSAGKKPNYEHPREKKNKKTKAIHCLATSSSTDSNIHQKASQM